MGRTLYGRWERVGQVRIGGSKTDKFWWDAV